MARQFLKVVALGVLIWSSSLVWPQVNQVLTRPVMASLVLVISTIVLIHILTSADRQGPSDDEPGQEHAPRPALVDSPH